MGDLRPLGSEKLQGMDKIKRILEIAQYKDVPKQETNNLSTLDYTIRLADGNVYGIVKEKSGYIIKKGLNESTLDYNEPMKHRKYYRSYSEAMKKLNLVASEMNRLFENENEIPLIGEQKKKFVLKGPKKDAPAAEPVADLPPAPMDTPAPPAPPAGDTPPPPDASAEPTDLPTDSEEPTDDMGMDDDMDMGGDELPSDDMGDEEELPAADDEEGDEEEEGPMGLKSIQKLTGKLSQKIRAFDKDQGLDSQDIKYVLNSIISAIDLSSLDEDDKEDILDKLDSTEEGDYGMGDEDLDMEPEDEFDTELGDMGSDEEMPSDEMDMEPTPAEEKEGYHHMMDSVFGESKVEKVLSKYFKIDQKEKTILEEKRKKNFLKEKLRKLNVKEEIISMSESLEQKVSALYVLKENKNAKFIGKTNKENLVFNIDGRQVKVTPRGRII